MGLAIVSLAIITPVDYQWTLWLYNHRHDGLKDFMANSVFELEPIGAGDFAVFLLIGIALTYLLSQIAELQDEKWKQRLRLPIGFVLARPWLHEWLRQNRHILGYLVICGLCCPLYLVHTLKWIIGRTRPGHVWDDYLPYSEWYEFGDFFMLRQYFHGSFPSGHSATAFMFTALAYPLLLIDYRNRFKGVALGFLGFSLAVLMAVSRCMSKDHWLSDSVFVIFASWALMHSIYFWGYRVNFLHRYRTQHKSPFPLPLFWELKLGFFLFLGCLGFMLAVNGFRAPFLGYSWGWMFMGVSGLVMAWLSFAKAGRMGFFTRY